ncbi:MAG: dethiobiotin synthase [Bacteroidales bacterium]|nr:dethiobiotin synthase [Bacteroidales bacterium]
MLKKIFIAGIGTNVGKTIFSAIIAEALKADYWKPMQAGNLKNTDSNVVKSLLSNSISRIYPEIYKFKNPLSPHTAAELEGIEIELSKIVLPETKNNLIIEGIGGLMVPMNNKGDMGIDLINKFEAEVILVSQNYLGSINHTLLSVEALKQRNIKITGIVFNGERNESGEKFILDNTNLKLIGSIEKENVFDKSVILKYAESFKQNFRALGLLT